MKLVAQFMIYVIAAIVCASWFVRAGSGENRRLAVYTATMSAAVALLIAAAISAAYDHPRPFVVRSDVVKLIPHGSDSSFPSDHATAAFAIAAGIGLYRARLGVMLLALAFSIAFARVYVGVHYPVDVAGGAALGILVAFAVWLARPLLRWLDRAVVLRLVPQLFL